MQAPYGTAIADPSTQKDIGSYVYNDPQPMYVVLQDNNSNGIVYYNNKDTSVTQKGTWNEWRIDLNDFIVQGVDPCDVRKMYIGIGNKDNPSSGSGTVYIDDIRLYPRRCLSEDRPSCDFTCDCVVDYRDLKIMTEEWLSTRCLRTDLYKEDPNIVNFRDFAILADYWLVERQPWPTW